MLEDFLKNLKELGDPGRASNQSLFIKGEMEVWGAPVPEMRRLVRLLPEPAAWELVPKLWKIEVREPRLAAVLILQRFAKKEPERVIGEVLKLADGLRHWEETDQLAIALGEAALKLGKWERVSDNLLARENLWAKRLGIVMLLKPLRKGLAAPEFVEAQLEKVKGVEGGLMKKAVAWVRRELLRVRGSS